MPNLFPIQFLALLGHAILRVTVGILLIRLGYQHLVNRGDVAQTSTYRLLSVGFLACIELGAGTLFVLGLFTQGAALITLVLSVFALGTYKKLPYLELPGRYFLVLLFASSLSLLITGAGFFAFDLPI